MLTHIKENSKDEQYPQIARMEGKHVPHSVLYHTLDHNIKQNGLFKKNDWSSEFKSYILLNLAIIPIKTYPTGLFISIQGLPC